MKKSIILFAALLFFPAALLLARGSGEEIIPDDPQVIKGVLDNGLTYYIRNNSYPENRAVLRLAVNTGSVLEDDDQQGLAHFVEHMAFNGSEKYSKNEIVDFLESLGMEFGPEINAHTSFDETVYKLQIKTDDPEQISTGFDVLDQWAFHLSFDHDEIDKERGVILEEWRLGRGADARMLDKAFPILFKDSKYGKRLPIGKNECIQGCDYETLKRFYKDWYRPDLMAIVAVGDFDSREMEKIIIEQFSSYSNPEISRERTEVDVPFHKETLFSIESDPEATRSMVQLINKYQQDPLRVPSDYKNKITEALYYSMLNNRLEELARGENPPFIAGGSYSSSYTKAVHFSSIVALTPEPGIETGLESILTEAVRADQHGFTIGELNRSKENLESNIESYYNERNNLESVYFANDLVNSFLNGNPIPSIEYEYNIYSKIIPEITLEDIKKISKDLLREENRVVLITTTQNNEIPIPEETNLLEILNSVNDMEISPYVDNFTTKELLSESPIPSEIINREIFESAGITELTLANGIKVILKPTDFKKDEILFTSYSPGGASIASDDDYVSAMFASSAISTCGVGEFSNIELQKQLAGKQINISPYFTDIDEGFNGSTRPADLETMFKLLYLTATYPRKDEIAWSSFMERVGESIKNRDSNPKQQYSDLLNSIMYSDHIRTRPLTTELLNEADLDKSLAFYKDRFADFSDFTFIFTGSFSAEEIEPLISTYLGGLPSSNRVENWVDREIKYAEGQISESLSAGIDPVSMVTLVYSGNFDWTRDELYKMISLEALLQTKLTKIVREEESGVYGIGVRFTPAFYPVADYNFKFSFSCDPTRTEELKNLVKSLIEEVGNGIFDKQIIHDVKEAQIVDYEESLNKNRWWLNQIENVWYYDYQVDIITNKKEMFESLTAEDIIYAAKKYLGDENLIEVVLYPAEAETTATTEE